jgi:hypothetical protein
MRVPFPAYEPLQLTTHERTRAYGRPDFSQTTTSIRRLYARDGYVLDKRRRNGGIRAVSARARTFSKLFPVLRIGIAFDAFKYYVRREPGLVCMVPDDRLKILFRMLSLFKAFIDPNIGVGLHHSF